MNKRIKELLNNLKKELSPVKKDIFSIVLHGSSVYSNKLKPHQDIDTYFILKKQDIKVYRKIKKILKDFCKKETKEEKIVYYSPARAGNTFIERNLKDEKQIFRIEIFFSYEKHFNMFWRGNYSFPRNLCKNYWILMGEDVKEYLPYLGYEENLAGIFDGFDKLQWNYVSIIESNFDPDIIYSSVQGGIFHDLGKYFIILGIKERRKDKMLKKLKEKSPEVYKKFKKIIIETEKSRNGEKINISPLNYFKIYRKFNKFVNREIHERIKNT
ncbi:MAG: hypothetical protein WC494_03615 [Candidatus Pacearchaeota archaeon]